MKQEISNVNFSHLVLFYEKFSSSAFSEVLHRTSIYIAFEVRWSVFNTVSHISYPKTTQSISNITTNRKPKKCISSGILISH